MRRTIIIFTTLLGVLQFAAAQQKPQYSQYPFNNYLINPAFAGLENYTDVKLGHRSQWQGIEGRPVTSYLTVTTPLGEGFLNGGEGSGNPADRDFTKTYMAAAPHHGLGLFLQSDQAGLIRQTSVQGSYAYHLGLAPDLNLAVGLSGGFSQYSLNTALVTTEHPDQALNGGFNNWNPDLSIGVLSYGASYFLGISAQQLLPQQVFNTGTGQSNAVPHFFLSGGGRAYLNDDISLMPSVLVKMVRPAPVIFDLNLKVSFRDVFWVGGAYRRNDSFGGLVGFSLNSFLNVGYAYDRISSDLNRVSTGSHEIVLGLMFNNRYRVKCPRFNY